MAMGAVAKKTSCEEMVSSIKYMFHSARSNHVLLQAQQMMPSDQLVDEVKKSCQTMEGRQIVQIILQPLTPLFSRYVHHWRCPGSSQAPGEEAHHQKKEEHH